MDEKLAELSASLDNQFYQGVAEPDKPNEFLLKLLGATTDAKFRDSSLEQAIRRGLVQSAFVRMSDKTEGKGIAKEMGDLYKKLCINEFKHDPGTVRVYVVGGRIYRALTPHADLDFVITVENPVSWLNLDTVRDEHELKKYRKFERIYNSQLRRLWESYELSAEGPAHEHILSPDIHNRGVGEQEARRQWAQDSQNPVHKRRAVLVYTC